MVRVVAGIPPVRQLIEKENVVTATEKKRLDQLEADVQALASLIVHTHGGKPALLEILARHERNGLETRPHSLPETRQKAVA